MDNTDDQEAVDVACSGFRNAVHSWCRKYTNLPLIEGESKKVAMPRNIIHLLNHLSHFTRQLTRKRRSLQSGLSYLQQTLWPETLKAFSTSRSSTEQAALLQHFLAQCLRLHDGKMLLVSGECRHPGDIRMAQAKKKKKDDKHATTYNKYPSQISLQADRPDGYTKLYNAPGGYSGYGWDEFHDPELGLRTRLFHAMQGCSKSKKKPKTTSQIAEYLTEHGAQALECLLDQHETEMTVVKQGFTTLRDRVVQDLKKTFVKTAPTKTVKVLFTLYDKLEKLQVGNIVLERHGNAFQVNDAQGALPNGYSIQDWSRVMRLPQAAATTTTASKNASTSGQQNKATSNNKSSTQPNENGKKRRRVIVDDDSSDDEKQQSGVAPPPGKKKQPATGEDNQAVQQSNRATKREVSPPDTPVARASVSGLQVKVKEVAKSPTLGERTSQSVVAIKTGLGVNPNTLETGREELEKEQANTSRAAKADEVEANTISIAEGESNIRNQRRVLGRVLARSTKDRDPKEIWDAREVLREQVMAVGNQVLWEPSYIESESSFLNDQKNSLLKALGYFQEARGLVKDQEDFRRQLNSQGTYTPTDSRFFSRNLLLLAGQAHTNLGITKIELATQTKRKLKYATKDSKQYLAKAIEELSLAKQFAESLRSRAIVDRERGSNVVETLVDYLRAGQLESLALRWWGTALWYQGMRVEASEMFESAASSFARSSKLICAENVVDNNNIVEALRQLGADCFYACTALVDLASHDMEKLPPTGGIQEGNEMFVFIQKLLRTASIVSQAVGTFFENNPSSDTSCDEYMEENLIMNQEAIRVYLAEIEVWWKRRKAIANRPISVETILPERQQVPHQRSEIERLGTDKLPTRVYTVRDGGGTRRNNKKKGPNPAYHKNSGNLLSSGPRQTAQLSSEDPPCDVQPKRSRPWGDELLPQIIDKSTGRSIPKIVYPAVAPPMPPEIRALLDAT